MGGTVVSIDLARSRAYYNLSESILATVSNQGGLISTSQVLRLLAENLGHSFPITAANAILYYLVANRTIDRSDAVFYFAAVLFNAELESMAVVPGTTTIPFPSK
jgi:hypothetical protein